MTGKTEASLPSANAQAAAAQHGTPAIFVASGIENHWHTLEALQNYCTDVLEKHRLAVVAGGWSGAQAPAFSSAMSACTCCVGVRRAGWRN